MKKIEAIIDPSKMQEVKNVLTKIGIRRLIVRPEYRHDWSNQDGFDSQHTTFSKENQDTIAIGIMYTW